MLPSTLHHLILCSPHFSSYFPSSSHAVFCVLHAYRCFANVCELDLIFHTDRIHMILDEIVMGGMVLETSLKEILKAVNGSTKYQRDTQSAAEQKTTVIGKRAQS